MKRLSTIILLICLSVQPVSILADYESENAKLKAFETVYFESLDFTPDRLRRYMLLIGIKFPEVVMKQARLESSHFTSNHFREGNNLFGMHLAKKRPTTAKGFTWGDTGGKFKVAKYGHWTESVKDYALWQEFHEDRIKQATDYTQFLVEAGYCEQGSYYITLLNSIRND